MYIKSYAKINLYLDVISKKDDGYHDLKMVMIPLELHDAIEITTLPYFKDDYITCDVVELRDSQFNTILLGMKSIKEKYDFTNKFNIQVHKEIPIRAGLGGGSSNAGAVMSYLNNYLKLNIPRDELLDMAKGVGADVPFFLDPKPSLVEGIGEKITNITLKHRYYVLIVKPAKGLSTKVVFQKSDELKLDHGNIDNVIKALETGDDDLLAESMFNALEKPAIMFAPEIVTFKNLLKNDGFKAVLMSGSGSAVYGLTTNRRLAKKTFRRYEKEGYEVYLTRTLK